MQNKFPLRSLLAAIFVASGAFVGFTTSQPALRAQNSAPQVVSRPQYRLDASIDYDLLTLKSSAEITIPASATDPLRDAVFFLYANAGGVGGDDERRKNLVVDAVTLDGAPVRWKLDGAVLRVQFPAPQSAPFSLKIDYHGVVPRGGKDEGAMGSLGALGGDISGILGLEAPKTAATKAKNTDYGLYTYGNGILSLGSFWYPTLAVRRDGRWADDAPEGLGDVAFSEKSDFSARLRLPKNVVLAAPGQVSKNVSGESSIYQVTARDAREFAVLASEDFVAKSKKVPIEGKTVSVSAILLKKNAAKLDKTLDVAGKALQIFSKRFGAYPFEEFKVVEAPMKNGAGGMEYSRMIGIASMLYGDLGSQLSGMMTSLNLPGADKLLESLGDEGGAAKADNPAADMLGGILGQQKEMWDSILETTIAHEVAHQWWAIGVGSDSQKHPFVDESLTNWSAMLYFEDRYGRETAEKMRDLHLKTSFSMGAMLGGGDKPANLPTSAYTNNLQYGAVIYGKGALFYGELRKLVGDAAFFGALRAYYAKYNNRIADPKSLRSLVEAQAPAKKAAIGALYKRWIEEAHGQKDIGGGQALDLGGLLGAMLGGNLGGPEE
ncbi:MAG: M1 family metallopeptidase [Armatimonadetes bacterium]|nr:M1 family metallopeptidase [Armatimonadota bacterium]